MDQVMLTLKQVVALIEQSGQTGLVLNGRVRFAKDTRQAEILRALVQRPQSPENLLALLRVLDTPQQSDRDISLTIAEFILDFGEYLED